MSAKSKIIILLLALLPAWLSGRAADLPELQGRVNDYTGTLSSFEVQQLERYLADFEERKGSQVVVAIVPTTEPLTIEEYSIELAEKWQIGRKGVDDGVILLVAKDDRKLRIEVGYGLEGAIPDAYAKRIIDRIIVPEFRQGNFYEGIREGVAAITTLIEGEELPAVTSDAAGSSGGAWFTVFFLALFFTVPFFGKFLKRLGVAAGISLLAALVTGTVFLGGMLMFTGLILSFLAGGRSGSSRGGVWMGGYSGGGGFSGGGFSGGGFSGGGGSFGGGGASGGW